ncbi:hypothetical protein [Yoonia sp. BS5-3]|uniref:Uncharacterized protein n=1 Tax=Yoonia phaeophyticola TaxID=3137369 RepID=A0ABZ2V8C1_9RHOB
MTFADLQADYDPARGLILTLPVNVFDPDNGQFPQRSLTVVINQASGEIQPSLGAFRP